MERAWQNGWVFEGTHGAFVYVITCKIIYVYQELKGRDTRFAGCLMASWLGVEGGL